MGFSCPCKNIAYPWNVFHTIFFHTFEFFFNTVQIVFIPLLKNFIHCTNCFITLNLFFHTFEFVFVPCKCFSYLVCERQISPRYFYNLIWIRWIRACQPKRGPAGSTPWRRRGCPSSGGRCRSCGRRVVVVFMHWLANCTWPFRYCSRVAWKNRMSL